VHKVQFISKEQKHLNIISTAGMIHTFTILTTIIGNQCCELVIIPVTCKRGIRVLQEPTLFSKTIQLSSAVKYFGAAVRG
jgi:hypothetical protein